MADENLMIQGFEDFSWDKKEKFKENAKLGKKFIRIAWSVEIIAVLIGLYLTFSTIYATFQSNPNKDFFNTILNIQGGLPFLALAALEFLPFARVALLTPPLPWTALRSMLQFPAQHRKHQVWSSRV